MKRLLGKIIAAAMCITLSVALLTGCGSGNVYGTPGAKYTTIDAIPGVTFAIPSSVAQATAITAISDDMNFDSNTTYSYKDGSTSYLLFNMGSIVIMAQKGTSFGFDKLSDAEKVNGLNNSAIINTWFTNPGKKFGYIENKSATGVYKMIASVSAGVTITTEIFGDFTGKLAVVSDGSTEYSLFIGAPGSMYDSLGSSAKDIMDTVAKSLKITSMSNASGAGTSYAVNIGNSAASGSEAESSSAVSSVSNSETLSSEDTSSSDDSSAAQSTSTVAASKAATAATAASTAKPSEDEVKIIDSASSDTASSKTSSATTEGSSKDSATTEVSTGVIKPGKKGTSKSLNLNNQKKERLSSQNSYFTDIYSAASVGENSKITVLDESGDPAIVSMQITDHYTGNDAVKLIKDYCNSTQARYIYQAAPVGTHWEAVKYSVDFTGSGISNGYVNVRFTGLDGEKLYYKGIGYSKRTYDINNNVQTDGTLNSGHIAYYPVPNGCTDYMLVCGDGTEETAGSAFNAYYRITE